ncbi:hypothetical protein [Hyphomonas sp.]|uniref:hypothetical protein n=1 Tax=Hyphomonas sp. TaxID=87 RepID=UPI000C8B38F2|nr:hypothetical protein [Hyphomonas sp.]MAL46988.1 hypothetical protein [Hyphomonas sp.]|tara:strand:+ start:160 stop:366 length:207 start_codon:yes stop_codon:yes gene_type:complete
MKKLLVTKDGTFEIDLTSEEIEERKQASKKFEEHKLVEAEKENKKSSGKQKLKDLGLDDDEIKALMGV